MNDATLLRIDGEVDRILQLSFDDLCRVDSSDQIADVSKIDPKRTGTAVKLSAVLDMANVRPTARFIGLHGTVDDFHASIPLGPVFDRAILIYRVGDERLSSQAGGPVRLYIPDFAACHTDEIDECANVKFLDHIELTREKGFDNRPEDDQEHQHLHDRQSH